MVGHLFIYFLFISPKVKGGMVCLVIKKAKEIHSVSRKCVGNGSL